MLPIETYKEGEKITKVCVEDIHKLLNRIIDVIDKAYNNSMEIIDDSFMTYDKNDGYLYEGNMVVGTGTATPHEEDIFNEDLGEEIAFRKAKLNANVKKLRLLAKVLKENVKVGEAIRQELDKLSSYICMDLAALNEVNPGYEERMYDQIYTPSFNRIYLVDEV